MWLTVGLLLWSATGLTWSRYAGGHFSAALDSVRSGTPSVATALAGAAPAPPAGHHGSGAATAGPPAPADPAAVDGVLKAARDNGITGPADTATAWTVSQTRNLWPVGRDSVAVDPATGIVVDRVDFADWPLLAKLTRWGINAHMGTLFGVVNQILLASLAVGLVCVIVWGYWMWWQRRPTRTDRRALAGGWLTPGRLEDQHALNFPVALRVPPAVSSVIDPLAALAFDAGRGDRDALTDLVRLTQHDIQRFLGSLTSPAEAEDLAQETYLRAVRALPQFAGRSSVRTWLFVIARRVAADHIRHLTRRPRTAALADWEAAADATRPLGRSRFEEHHALTDLIHDLADDRREAFLLTQVTGFSYAEAAEICGCPVGTIRSRVARAREDLVSAIRDRDGQSRNTAG